MSDRPVGILLRDGPILALFLALTAVMTNPLVLHLGNAVEDKADALLNTWIIAWVGHALITDPFHLFDANIFYPYRNTLAFSEVQLPQGLLALPINLASGNTVLGYNLVLLFSFLLAAYSMYLLVFDLTHQRAAGAVAGIIFAFNPYNLGNLAQVQLLSFGWLPLALLFLQRTVSNSQLATNNWRCKNRDTFLFALFFSLQTLSSIYYGFLAGIAVVLYVVWSLITHRVSRIAFYVSLLVRLSISAVIIAILVVPVLLPYLEVQRELGFQRNLEESEQFSASLKLFAEVSARNVIYGSFLSPRPPIMAGGYPQDNLFPGLVPLILAIAGLIAVRNRERWFYLCLLLLAFVLALGPWLFITPTLGTSITLPYRWLYDAIPFVHALRAPVRFDALIMLALAVLAGMGVGAVGSGQWTVDSRQEAVGSRRKAGSVLLPLAPSTALRAGVCVLICFEYFALPAASITPVPVGDAIPPYVHWLAQQPRGTVLELPMIENERDGLVDLISQYLSTFHWQSTPDGYSGFDPKPHGAITYEMQFFPNDRTDALLRALDVRYVVVHGSRIDDWQSRRIKITDTSGLVLVQQFGDDEVYLVTPRVQGPALLSPEPYLPSPVAPNANFTAYLIFQNRREHSTAIKPTDALAVQARWSNGTIQKVSTSLPLVTSSVSVVPVTLLAPQVGNYHLSLHVSESSLGVWDLAGDVSVRDEEPTHQVVLPAQAVLNSALKAVYRPGDKVEVGVTWRALNKIDYYYSVSVRVVDAQGNKKTDAGDREPATKTMLWVPGSEIPDQFLLTLPPDLTPGEYSVQLLMYQPNLGEEALLLDDQFIPRATIELGKFSLK